VSWEGEGEGEGKGSQDSRTKHAFSTVPDPISLERPREFMMLRAMTVEFLSV
jgi:hypothetical protein